MKQEGTVTSAPSRGRMKTGLIVLLCVVLAIGVIVAVVFRLPQKIGLVKGAGAKMTAETPERMTAAEILAEAETKGFKAEGAEIYVFPKPESGDAVLYGILAFSDGFAFSRVGSYHPVIDTLVLLGSGEKLKEHAVTHIGLQFRDEEGKSLMTVAATTEDIRALVAGTVTEEDFRSRVDYRVELPNYLNRSYNPF